MLRASRRIQSFVEEIDRERFREDELRQSAVVFQLFILGEAAKHVSEDLRASYDHIPWSKMARMRDRLIHGYFDVDLEIVWTTATRDVVTLVDQLEEIVD
jgi:uncharacterized protein with HEPN domain